MKVVQDNLLGVLIRFGTEVLKGDNDEWDSYCEEEFRG